ncbi:MAG TPA: RNA 2',3'-cyclic phosphodiesterase [Pyrinomonadaceae bacterium]|nr:RNA 2',3'-cyclic phosphodiesterase [Pyrinomonadaceae bacterium]
MANKTDLRRIFIAIELSDAARSECFDHVQRLRHKYPSANVGWERAEKLHITVKFLGPTTDDILEKLNAGLDEKVRTLGRGILRLSGPGIFPNKSRPRILWIGADDRDGLASKGQASVEEVCRSLGFEPDDRRFTPHITIGRVKDPQSAQDLVAGHLRAQIEPVEFEVDGLVVYESKLLPTGSVYSVISRFVSR